MKSSALILCLSLSVGQAHAEYISGNDLLSRLNSESYSDRGFALGYVAGVADALDGFILCIPEGVTIGQLKDITTTHLRASAQTRHKSAAGLIMDALVAVWPCKKGSKS